MTPESIENSKALQFLTEQLSYKISDLFSLPDLNKLYPSKETLAEGLSKLDFFKLSEDKQTIYYNINEDIAIFLILNLPLKMTKSEVATKLEILDLKYSRLYKQSLFWVLATNDKEAQICIKNSLRELYIDSIKIKFDYFNKSQLVKNMKDLIDKNSYKKEAKNLGIGYNSPGKRKNSDSSYGSGGSGYRQGKGYYKGSGNYGETNSNNSDNFSWRKGSNNGGAKNSFDSSGKYYGGNYYKGNYQKGNFNFKRNRFNSDGNNTNNNKYKNSEEEIEIDVSSLKYSLNIKYKYTFQEMKNLYEQLKKENYFNDPPKFLSEGLDEILIKDKPKEVQVLDNLIEEYEKKDEGKEKEETKQGGNNSNTSSGTKPTNNNNSASKIEDNKIPKMNPLSSLPKMFNKFDMIAGNIPQWGSAMSTSSPAFIKKEKTEEESKKDK